MSFSRDVRGHETSVPQLAAVDDGLWSGEYALPTLVDRKASMDSTAMFHGSPAATLVHSRYVKAVFPLPNGFPYVLTGSEDEHIRVWDASNLVNTNKTPLSIVVAHCGEVTAFGLWESRRGSQPEVMVVSASLDGTLRRWSIKGTSIWLGSAYAFTELLNPPELDFKPQTVETTMTEEEERELAELLSDEE